MNPFSPEPVPTPAGAGPDRLGPRVEGRPDPRLTIALAAAGCALAILGALLIGGDGLDGDDGDGSQLPGVAVSLVVVVVGFGLLVRQQSGPLATAGSVASTFGVPPLLFFLTFDEGSFPPYSTETILGVSTVAWAVAWWTGPGRGRMLSLGAAALGLWTFVIQVTEDVFTFPFDLFLGFETSFEDDSSFGGGFQPDVPDPTVIGVLSLAFGACYLLLARRWDLGGRAGAATPLTAVAIVCLLVGVVSMADDLETAGTGILAAAVGTAVAAHGASVGRRATTWLGAAGAALGLLAIVGEITDEPTPGGFLLVVVGVGVIAAAEALRRAVDEPPEFPAGKESVKLPQ